MLIILEGSLNVCRLSCPILDEKEAIKEPSKTLLGVINQFPKKFFVKIYTRWRSFVKTKLEVYFDEKFCVFDN